MKLFKVLKPYKSIYPELDCCCKEFIDKTIDIEQLFDKIAMELCQKNKKDLMLIESKLRDSINEIETYNLISIAISLFGTAMGILLNNVKFKDLAIGIIPIAIVYIHVGTSITRMVKHYRYYKFCLQIVDYIKKDEIKVENKLVKCIAAVENASK